MIDSESQWHAMQLEACKVDYAQACQREFQKIETHAKSCQDAASQSSTQDDQTNQKKELADVSPGSMRPPRNWRRSQPAAIITAGVVRSTTRQQTLPR